MRINKENTIGLLIDIQERLYPVMMEKEQLLKNCKILVTGLKELGLDILVTQQYTKGLGTTLNGLSELIPDFSPIEKTAFSCCGEETLLSALEKSDKGNVVICGIEAHVCVLQTAVDLKQKGYNPIIVFDCISSRKEADMLLAMERYRYEGIMVTSCEAILFELTGNAKNPAFKAISKLVK